MAVQNFQIELLFPVAFSAARDRVTTTLDAPILTKYFLSSPNIFHCRYVLVPVPPQRLDAPRRETPGPVTRNGQAEVRGDGVPHSEHRCGQYLFMLEKISGVHQKIFQTPSMACWPCAATTRGRAGTGPPASTTPPTRTCSPASAHPRVCPPQPPRPRPAR